RPAVPSEHAQYDPARRQNDLTWQRDEVGDEGPELHAKQLVALLFVLASPTRRNGKQESSPGFERPSERCHDHVRPVRAEGIHGRVKRAHSVLELLVDVLLIAPLAGFMNDSIS